MYQSFNGARRRLRILSALIAAAFAVASLAACSSPTENETHADGSGTVRIALQPLLDYVPWVFAQEHGLAEEQELTLEISYLSQINTALQAMARGDLDMVSTCTACNMPYVQSVPTLRDVLTINQFKGFIIVGRTGAPEYEKLIDQGASEDEARTQIYEYIKGKTFIGNEAIFGALVDGLLEYAGLERSDIEIIDLADDAKAATAFLQGQGDFYMGSLAQEAKLAHRS
jgi:ABC-type nitrate/sulfonate/bicarbonate transport system substrate-binding protein